MEILGRVSPLMEQVSIDEAFIDITGTEALHGAPKVLACRIKQEIIEATALTCSVGIAPNRFLAKIASDLNKPDGLTIIEAAEVPGFLKALPITKIPGIGEKTAGLLKSLGVTLVGDILRYPREFWVDRLGKSGLALYEKAQGKGSAEVVPHAEPKSCSAEDTFPKDTEDVEELKKWLLTQVESVGRELRIHGYRGKTITLKVKFADFRQFTRSRTILEPTNSTQVIFQTALQLLEEVKLTKKVRLIGVGVSNFRRGLRQTRLFADSVAEKQEKLDAAVDAIHDRFGRKALKRGRIIDFDQ
jgi:DNA polymerase-4